MNHLRIIKKSFRLDKKTLLISALFIFGISIITPLAAQAIPTAIESAVVGAIGFIARPIASLLGSLTVTIMHILINFVAPYNDFIGLQTPGHPVEVGWVIVRDLSNMFFIIVLLLIAFGTMLRIPGYNYKEMLSKLVIYAILINFSRTITGIVIDASQVIMLTFVNAFQAAAGGNLATILGIHQLFQISPDATEVGVTTIIISYLLAIIFLVVALITVLILTLTLAQRIVMLWMLTILSPAAFFAKTFKKGEQYYSQWWEKLICWAGSGPVLAFFLWLALATTATAGQTIRGTGITAQEGQELSLGSFATDLAKEGNIIRFIIGILMLLFGVQMGQKFCAVGTSIMKSATQTAKKYGTQAAKAVARSPFKAVNWADYQATARFGSSPRAGFYRGLSYVPGMKTFAAGRIANIQKAAAERYNKTKAVTAEAAAQSPAAILQMASSRALAKGVLRGPETDARQAAFLREALTNFAVGKHLKSTLGDEGAKKKREELFKEFQALAGRTRNKEIGSAFYSVKKEFPHLISSDDPVKTAKEKRDIAGTITASEGLKLSPEALKDIDVVGKGGKEGGLSDATILHIIERGSAEQVNALRETMGKPELLRPEPTRRQNRRRAAGAGTPPIPPQPPTGTPPVPPPTPTAPPPTGGTTGAGGTATAAAGATTAGAAAGATRTTPPTGAPATPAGTTPPTPAPTGAPPTPPTPPVDVARLVAAIFNSGHNIQTVLTGIPNDIFRANQDLIRAAAININYRDLNRMAGSHDRDERDKAIMIVQDIVAKEPQQVINLQAVANPALRSILNRLRRGRRP